MKYRRIALLLILFLPIIAQAAQIKGVRMWSSPDGTRVVFAVVYGDYTIEVNLLSITKNRNEQATIESGFLQDFHYSCVF